MPMTPLECTTNAYWISPLGDILEVPTNHAKAILDNLDFFGITKQEITDIVNITGDPLIDGGKTRTILFTRLFEQGWIRIRLIPKYSLWKIQTDFTHPFIPHHISIWAALLLASQPNQKEALVIGLDEKGNHIWGNQLFKTGYTLESLTRNSLLQTIVEHL